MRTHLDTGGNRARCHLWRPKPAWSMSMFLADVDCARCQKLGALEPGASRPGAVFTPPSDSDREAWLEWRRGGLGGSDMAVILGLSPWSTPFDVWMSKVHPLPDTDSRAMHMGRRLERTVGEAAAIHWGLDLHEVGPAERGDAPIVRGTGDFLLGDGSGLECKTARAMWDAVPTHYEVQARWYMEVYGIDVWRVACLHHGQDFTFWTFERDRAIGDAMVRKGQEWWERHIVGGVHPPLQGRSASAYLHMAHRHDTGMEVLAEDLDEQLFHAWHATCEAVKQFEQRRDELALQLKARIGDARGIKGSTWRLKWSRFDRKTTDWSALKADPERQAALDALTAPFTSTTPTGRLYPTLETT